MTLRNNVTRLPDARRFPYEVFEFEAEKLSAEEVAARLGVPPEHVYKTLVVLREARGKKPLLVMAPAGRELNLKAVAASVGEKKLKMAMQREAEALTRLQVGGISALALLNRGFEMCLERAVVALPWVYVSAGQRGANLRLKPAALITRDFPGRARGRVRGRQLSKPRARRGIRYPARGP